jgi:hypothetical protein
MPTLKKQEAVNQGFKVPSEGTASRKTSLKQALRTVGCHERYLVEDFIGGYSV